MENSAVAAGTFRCYQQAVKRDPQVMHRNARCKHKYLAPTFRPRATRLKPFTHYNFLKIQRPQIEGGEIHSAYSYGVSFSRLGRRKT